MTNSTAWLRPTIKGLLLDITGVLYDSGVGDGKAIFGSIEAVKKLQSSTIPVRFCSNESTNTRQQLVDKLHRLGFSLKVEQIFTPAPAAVKILKERRLRPHLLVAPTVIPEFDEISQEDPNCVVMGDAQEHFNYENMNKSFQLLMELKNPILFALGVGKYYKETDGLKLDVGAYMKALEYACDIKAEIVGKPSKEYFFAALNEMKLKPEEAVMIGDDLLSDVGGAQKSGLRGVLVRTGKFRPAWENHPEIRPDGIVDNLKEAVDLIL